MSESDDLRQLEERLNRLRRHAGQAKVALGLTIAVLVGLIVVGFAKWPRPSEDGTVVQGELLLKDGDRKAAVLQAKSGKSDFQFLRPDGEWALRGTTEGDQGPILELRGAEAESAHAKLSPDSLSIKQEHLSTGIGPNRIGLHDALHDTSLVIEADEISLRHHATERLRVRGGEAPAIALLDSASQERLVLDMSGQALNPRVSLRDQGGRERLVLRLDGAEGTPVIEFLDTNGQVARRITAD